MTRCGGPTPWKNRYHSVPKQVDLFIQAGDIVKGGKQDRTIGTDFVVPARSGAYCTASRFSTPLSIGRHHST